MYRANVMVKQDIPSIFQAALHLFPNTRVLNLVCPVEVGQIQVARAAHPHSLGLQHKALAYRIHDIQCGLLVIKPVGKRPVNRIIDILRVERPNDLSILFDGTLYGIGPRAHIIHIGLGDRQSHDRTASGKIQSLLCKPLPGIGHTLRFSGQDQ